MSSNSNKMSDNPEDLLIARLIRTQSNYEIYKKAYEDVFLSYCKTVEAMPNPVWLRECATLLPINSNLNMLNWATSIEILKLGLAEIRRDFKK